MHGATLLMMLVTIAEGRLEEMSEEVKEAFRYRGEAAKKFAENCDKLAHKGRAFEGVPEYLKPLAEMKRKQSIVIGRFLRSGKRDGVDILLRVIISRNEKFDCWAALSSVLKSADILHISPGGLEKKAERAGKPMLWTEEEK
jgi:hypothetical protein